MWCSPCIELKWPSWPCEGWLVGYRWDVTRLSRFYSVNVILHLVDLLEECGYQRTRPQLPSSCPPEAQIPVLARPPVLPACPCLPCAFSTLMESREGCEDSFRTWAGLKILVTRGCWIYFVLSSLLFNCFNIFLVLFFFLLSFAFPLTFTEHGFPTSASQVGRCFLLVNQGITCVQLALAECCIIHTIVFLNCSWVWRDWGSWGLKPALGQTASKQWSLDWVQSPAPCLFSNSSEFSWDCSYFQFLNPH